MTLDEAALRYGRCLIKGPDDLESERIVHRAVGDENCFVIAPFSNLCTIGMAAVMYAQDVAAGRHGSGGAS